MTPEIIVESGDTGHLNFAEAEVRKPLLAVSAVNAKGSPVWFDGAQSFILPKAATELAEALTGGRDAASAAASTL